jgi:hypothetical protein
LCSACEARCISIRAGSQAIDTKIESTVVISVPKHPTMRLAHEAIPVATQRRSRGAVCSSSRRILAMAVEVISQPRLTTLGELNAINA